MVREAGTANPRPEGRMSTAVPLTSLGSDGSPCDASMMMLTCWKSSPGGVTSVTGPPKPVMVAPAGPAGPPFRTVIVAVALLPPLAAVMVSVPGATPVTIPDPETPATALLLDDQSTRAPEIAFPDPSLGVAAS